MNKPHQPFLSGYLFTGTTAIRLVEPTDDDLGLFDDSVDCLLHGRLAAAESDVLTEAFLRGESVDERLRRLEADY